MEVANSVQHNVREAMNWATTTLLFPHGL